MPEAKQTLKLLAVPLSFSFTWKASPDNSNLSALSCVNSHANSTPVQLCATCMCLPNNKAKENGHYQKTAKAFDNYLVKEGCLEDPFSKQILRNYQPCVSTPKTPEQHKERVNQQNAVYHKSCPRLFSCNLGGTSHEQQ